MSANKATVAQIFAAQPSFSCANCAAAIVGRLESELFADRTDQTSVQALQDELISKSFSGRDGRGYLMNSADNVKLGRREDRVLSTGKYVVADVFCLGCDERIGWFYHTASDNTQKYKEGKFLLEREKLIKENAWRLDE
ncbi:Protein yippee-like 1 [Termitomyces sp. J132]|nr:Protein yippee-like 1 [Termitomyces sp. J132]